MGKYNTDKTELKYSNDYNLFLKEKEEKRVDSGFDVKDEELNKHLFDWQKEIVKWCLKKGKCALFEDTGMGKTIQQLAWADAIVKHTKGKVLILAPLAVSKQTAKEGDKFGIKVNIIENEEDIKDGINITNYEKLHKFDTSQFIGICLDESSILKSYSGKTTMELIDLFRYTPYKLSCSATPSPNDYTELGNQAEFLNVMTMNEMLAMYFINDASHGNGWRLKGHSEFEFYKWITEWAILINNPSNLGYDGSMYNLPKLNINKIILKSKTWETDTLFAIPAETLGERREARKSSIPEKIEKIKELVKDMDNCLIWCDFNYESEELKKAIPEGYEIKGSDNPEYKEKGMTGFSDGTVKILISKPSICGFGMNWQNCNNMIFCGLSDSYEQFYQAIRRCWRFGQTKEVNVYVIISDKETNMLENIKKKELQHQKMSKNMIDIMSAMTIAELNNKTVKDNRYLPKIEMQLPSFI